VKAPVFSWDGVPNMQGYTLQNKVTVDYSQNLKSTTVAAQLKTTSESFVPFSAAPKPAEVKVVIEAPKKTEQEIRIEERL